MRTRSYADVAASACGGMAVEQRHARNSVVSGGFPVTTWVRVGRVPRGGESRRFAPYLRGGGRGKFSAGWWYSEAGRKQPGTGIRQHMVGVDTPSLHPEVPGIQFVSPGHGLDIRQSMGWTKVCVNHTVGDLGAKG